MIPEEKIAEIRDAIDLVALINEHVPLKRQGTRFVGLCPFHNEKTPSFGVSRGKNFYYCFGCHASGDAITFLVQHQGHGFLDAVEILAERAGIELPRLSGPEESAQRRARDRREKLAHVMELATAFYEAQLRDNPQAELARQEIARRNVSAETARTFRLGYAPAGWEQLARHLQTEGVSVREAAELGLLAPRRSGDGHYDRFRHRLMFPVADSHGRVVAFSGRALPPLSPDESEPPAKYINSPEGPLYTKGSVLFGMHQARVAARREGEVLLCEGNFDLLAIHQAGFANVLAPLGTAFTLQQARLLRRYGEKLTLVFDGDRAGVAAAAKAVELGQEAGLQVRVVSLPVGEDPDTFIRAKGVEVFSELVNQAPSAVEFLIDRAAEGAEDPASTARGIRGLGPLLARIESPVERDLYVERVGRRFGLRDTAVVRAELRKGVLEARGASRRGSGPSQRGSSAHPEPPPEAQDDAHVGTRMRPLSSFRGLEVEVLGAMLEHPQLFDSPEAGSFEELLTDPDLRAIFRVTANMVSSVGEVRAAELLDKLADNPARAWLAKRLSEQSRPSFEYAHAALRDSLPRLTAQRLQGKRVELHKEIVRARNAGDHERAAALMKEHTELLQAQRRGALRGENGG